MENSEKLLRGSAGEKIQYAVLVLKSIPDSKSAGAVLRLWTCGVKK
jgi:hypothetical protein